MANDLTKSGALPGIIEDDGAELVDSFVAVINTERGHDALPRLPTPAEQGAMERRLSKLTAKLRPTSMSTTQEDDALQLIGQLFTRYPSLGKRDISVMSSAYLDDLGRLPLFAIKGAIDDVIYGRIEGLEPDYPPSSPRLYKAGEAHLVEPAVVLNKAKRVLAIRTILAPISEETRERVGEMVAEFVASRRVKQDDEARIGREDHAQRWAGPTSREMILAEYRALGVPPVTAGRDDMLISPSLARQLGRLPARKPENGEDD